MDCRKQSPNSRCRFANQVFVSIPEKCGHTSTRLPCPGNGPGHGWPSNGSAPPLGLQVTTRWPHGLLDRLSSMARQMTKLAYVRLSSVLRVEVFDDVPSQAARPAPKNSRTAQPCNNQVRTSPRIHFRGPSACIRRFGLVTPFLWQSAWKSEQPEMMSCTDAGSARRSRNHERLRDYR